MNKNLLRYGLIALLLLLTFAWYRYRQPNFIMGDTAPDFEVSLLNGEKARLSDLKGKYVLLQFWGSWCGPCRAENRDLVQLYQAYHDRGFEIFSIGIEEHPEAWQRAIVADGLVWKHHAMEAQTFTGGQARQYNITSIPTTFLINPDGMIAGVNLPPDQIAKTLAARLPALQ
jgi:peroxiredoxin